MSSGCALVIKDTLVLDVNISVTHQPAVNMASAISTENVCATRVFMVVIAHKNVVAKVSVSETSVFVMHVILDCYANQNATDRGHAEQLLTKQSCATVETIGKV